MLARRRRRRANTLLKQRWLKASCLLGCCTLAVFYLYGSTPETQCRGSVANDVGLPALRNMHSVCWLLKGEIINRLDFPAIHETST